MSKCDTKTASSAWQKTEVWNEVRSHFSLQGRVPTRCTWGLLTATLLWLSQVAWTHRSARCRDWPRFKVTLESRSNPLQSAFSMLHWTLASIVFSGKIMFVQGCSGKYAKYRNYERPYIIYQQLQSKAPRLLTTTSPMLNVVETPMHRSKLACLKIYHNMWDSASWEHSFRSLRICAILKIWRCIGPKKWFGHPQSTVEKREEKSRPRLLFAEYHPSSVRLCQKPFLLFGTGYVTSRSCLSIQGPKGPSLQESHQSQNPGSPSLRGTAGWS